MVLQAPPFSYFHNQTGFSTLLMGTCQVAPFRLSTCGFEQLHPWEASLFQGLALFQGSVLFQGTLGYCLALFQGTFSLLQGFFLACSFALFQGCCKPFPEPHLEMEAWMHFTCILLHGSAANPSSFFKEVGWLGRAGRAGQHRRPTLGIYRDIAGCLLQLSLCFALWRLMFSMSWQHSFSRCIHLFSKVPSPLVLGQ